MELCLCGVGGAVHFDELEDRLTRSQIIDWLAFYRIRPFGTKRDDMRAALQTYWQVSASIAEAPEDHSPKKYMLDFGDGPPLTEAQSIIQRIKEKMSR